MVSRSQGQLALAGTIVGIGRRLQGIVTGRLEVQTIEIPQTEATIVDHPQGVADSAAERDPRIVADSGNGHVITPNHEPAPLTDVAEAPPWDDLNGSSSVIVNV